MLCYGMVCDVGVAVCWIKRNGLAWFGVARAESVRLCGGRLVPCRCKVAGSCTPPVVSPPRPSEGESASRDHSAEAWTLAWAWCANFILCIFFVLFG